ncbi:MAG TPA: carboxypeptidase-like regulatory domain-containing protein [Gemmatimonadaceae bacterium]
MRPLCLFILLMTVGCSRGTVSGELVDYATGEPIAAASITAHSRGWGISNKQLVWDKSYTAGVDTDTAGKFIVSAPGPRFLTLGGTTLSVEATGYQRLAEIRVSGKEPLLLQTVRSVPRTERVPGGIAYIGITESGRPFGWIFAEDRPTLDRRLADIFPLDSVGASAPTVTLAAGERGGLLFLSREEQHIATTSHGMFLRYTDTAPLDGYRPAITIDPRGAGGTIFVRTANNRFAKMAFATPLSTMRGRIAAEGIEEPAAWALSLAFAYNPFPGHSLAYDPGETSGVVDPAIAGAAADLPSQGEPSRGPRRYLIEVVDTSGAVIDSVTVRLVPGIPVDAGDVAQAGYRFGNITLRYGADGLPNVRMSIESRAAVYNTADIIPNSRFAVRTEFHDYSSENKAVRRELRIIEVR